MLIVEYLFLHDLLPAGRRRAESHKAAAKLMVRLMDAGALVTLVVRTGHKHNIVETRASGPNFRVPEWHVLDLYS